MKTLPALLVLANLCSAIPLKDAQSSQNVAPFIVSGEVAGRGQFPYQAAVYMDMRSFCGGSLISTKWILTAAHCVDRVAMFAVYLGAQDMMLAQEANRQLFNSRIGIIHEQYNRTSLQNDMGLVQLYRHAVLNEYVQPIRLPGRSQLQNLFVDKDAVVSGWGRTGDSATISPLLRFVEVNIMSNELCTDKYDSEPIFPTTLCARAYGLSSTCNGDSGGPLVITGVDNVPTQVGVVSFVSNSGCDKGFPFGFSRLTSYMPWVTNKTGIPLRD